MTDIPEGWQLVPICPTREMIGAISMQINVIRDNAPAPDMATLNSRYWDLWIAALNAAPLAARDVRSETTGIDGAPVVQPPLTKAEVEALIDYHDHNAAGAEAMGIEQSDIYHQARGDLFRTLRRAMK